MNMVKMIFLFCFTVSFAYVEEISQSREPISQKMAVSSPEGKASELKKPTTVESAVSLKEEENQSNFHKKTVKKEGAGQQVSSVSTKKESPVSGKETQIELSDQDYLIEKLDYLKSVLPENHKALKAIQLRLAHVLSLKAEENFIKAEIEKCKACKTIAGDSAKKSLSLYQSLDLDMAKFPLLHTKSLFRKAYLYRFLGKKKKALFELKRVAAKDKIDSSLKTRAWFSIGELYFEQYDYQNSLEAFNRVLSAPSSPWSFKAFYRKIWSLSNLSFYESSLDHLESFLSSDLYSKSKEQKLKQKLEKELITLYSYGKVTEKRLFFLYAFLKQNLKQNSLIERKKRLFDLARALSRIGRIKESNKVWWFYLSKKSSLDNQLQAYSFMIANDLMLSSSDLLEEVVKKAGKVFNLFQTIKVSQSFKILFQKQMKGFFNKIKNSKLSEKQKRNILFLYQKYSSFYLGDVEILSRAADLARDLKEYLIAGTLFQKAVLSIDTQKSDQKELKENMSLLQMEMAELSKDKKERIRSYDFYIQHGSSKEMLFKARYQTAYIHYENKDYQKTFKEFQKLALHQLKGESKEIYELRLKAAHLSLSSLVSLKDPEEDIIRLTGLFIKEFPKEKTDFTRICHTALLNQVKKLVSKTDFSHRPIQASSDKNILKAWEVLKLFSIQKAIKEEAFTYHFNRLLIAKERLEFAVMEKSMQALLAYKGLSEKDRETVLKWKLWLAELQFDFKEVLRIVKLLQQDPPTEEHILRLARLTELAGGSPVEHYQSFIKKFPQSPSLMAVFTSLMDKSSLKNQKIFLKNYALLFKDQPERLVQMILKIDKGRLDKNFFKTFVTLDFMKGSSLVSFLKKKEAIEFFEKELSPTASYLLPKNLQGRRLTRAIKNYSQKLEVLADVSQKTLKARDWVVRVFVLFHWEKELSRFYSSIMELPLPKGLNEEEEQSYVKLLEDQLQPYKDQAVQLKQEWEKLWSRDFVSDYQKSFQQGQAFYAFFKWEMEKLFMIADTETKQRLDMLLASLQKPEIEKEVKEADVVHIQSLYQSLKKDPFDKKSLVQLLDIEKKRNNKAMSYYLADRIKSLNEGNKGMKL